MYIVPIKSDHIESYCISCNDTFLYCTLWQHAENVTNRESPADVIN